LRHQNLQAFVRITVTAVALAGLALYGQEWRESVGEVSGMGGGTAGGLKTHPVITGSAGVSLSRYLMLMGETTVIPLSNQTLIPTAAAEVRGSDLFDFNIALQGRIPIKKWDLYGVFGMAVLMNPYTAGIQTPSGAIAYVGQRHSKFGLEWGAGYRYFVKENWGVRMEYRYTSSTRNFNRVTGGLFYQFDSELFSFLPAFARHLTR
jgi:opacity protein-like surface antigen